jgi:hypothetical protein
MLNGDRRAERGKPEMEILRKHEDGTLELGWAYFSYQKYPHGEWMQGDLPLNDRPGEIMARGPRAKWMFEARSCQCRKIEPSQ